MIETTWTEERVRRLIAEHDFAYQNIELPYGLSTGGRDRSATGCILFPDDMTGKSVLDLGCKYGYFCFEALKRGAGRVLGVDVDSESVRKARLLASCLGLQASFEVRDVEKDPIDESFDYVLCLNLLHHLKNPIGMLDRLVDLTRERLVLEVAALGRHDRRKVGVSALGRLAMNRAPIIFVSENGTSSKRSVQKFFLTPSALDNLLLHQRKTFARVDTVPSEHKNRFISVAHKRRIDRMVVVSGPTSAGKSTLIDRLVRGGESEIARRVGIDDPSEWVVASASKLGRLTEPRVEKLLFHYDFLRPYMRSAKVHARDEALGVLDTARQVTFVTIWCPPPILRERLEAGELAPRTTLGIYWGKKRHKKLHAEYADGARVCAHYRNWLEYARTRSGDHVVVSLADGVKLYSPDEWGELARAYEGS